MNHRVGGEVDGFCSRCKLTLAHTVLAMVGVKIARVRCNTCGGDHAFRSTPTRTRAASAPRASHERVIISFEQLLAGKDLAKATRYTAKETYQVDQLIDHPTFGVGIVSGVREDKVDVVFKASQKTLVHRRGDSATPKPAFHLPRPSVESEENSDPQERAEEAREAAAEGSTTRPPW